MRPASSRDHAHDVGLLAHVLCAPFGGGSHSAAAAAPLPAAAPLDISPIQQCPPVVHGLALVLTAAAVFGGSLLAAQRLKAPTNLPLVTLYLFYGVLCGPGLSHLLAAPMLLHLDPLVGAATALIAWRAGSELTLRKLLPQLRPVLLVCSALTVVTISGTLLVCTFVLPLNFMRGMSMAERAAVSLLVGAIFVARSPSSALAIISELDARGPFTTLALSVSICMDVALIVLFAVCLESSSLILDSHSPAAALAAMATTPAAAAAAGGDAAVLGLDPGLSLLAWLSSATMVLLQPLLVILASLLVGLALALLVGALMRSACVPRQVAPAAHALAVFVGGAAVHQTAHAEWLELSGLRFEPMLAVVTAGAILANAPEPLPGTLHAAILLLWQPIVCIFFTLAGASLNLGALAHTIGMTLVLFSIRLACLMLGAYTGGRLAGLPASHCVYGWLGYITQAGVSMGLAREVTHRFPHWGWWGGGLETVMRGYDSHDDSGWRISRAILPAAGGGRDCAWADYRPAAL